MDCKLDNNQFAIQSDLCIPFIVQVYTYFLSPFLYTLFAIQCPFRADENMLTLRFMIHGTSQLFSTTLCNGG